MSDQTNQYNETTSVPVLEVHNMTVSYRNKVALWDIDFEIDSGQIIGIIGPNGSGKTTLLKSIMRLIPIQSGYVKIFGKALPRVRSQISYVPQRNSVDWDFPATVMDVVKMGCYTPKNIFKWTDKRDTDIAAHYLDQIGMLSMAKRQISQLSGGQQQRCFIARALTQQSELYLMDEPFVGIDMATEKTIIKLLRNLKAKKKTIVIVHHDLQTAFEYFDTIILLNTRLVASGKTSQVLTSENIRLAYGGQLDILAKLQQLITQKQFFTREEEMKET